MCTVKKSTLRKFGANRPGANFPTWRREERDIWAVGKLSVEATMGKGGDLQSKAAFSSLPRLRKDLEHVRKEEGEGPHRQNPTAAGGAWRLPRKGGLWFTTSVAWLSQRGRGLSPS